MTFAFNFTFKCLFYIFWIILYFPVFLWYILLTHCHWFKLPSPKNISAEKKICYCACKKLISLPLAWGKRQDIVSFIANVLFFLANFEKISKCCFVSIKALLWASFPNIKIRLCITAFDLLFSFCSFCFALWKRFRNKWEKEMTMKSRI